MKAIVTVKLPKCILKCNPKGFIDVCPISKIIGIYHLCTDSGGQHHSYIETGDCIRDIERIAKTKFAHVTRIEPFDEDE